MPSYSAFSLRLTLRAIRGTTPNCAFRPTNHCLAGFAWAVLLLSPYGSSRYRLRLLITWHRTRLLLLGKNPFQEGGHSATLVSQGEARVRWFQCLLGAKIPRLAVFHLPATRL